eukprot:4502639-Pyramimonas_sp.AAC.1
MGCGSGTWADSGRSNHPSSPPPPHWTASGAGHPPSLDKLPSRSSKMPPTLMATLSAALSASMGIVSRSRAEGSSLL